MTSRGSYARRSMAWRYFEVQEDDQSRAVCNLCKKVYAYKGQTTNLLLHLKTAHGLTGAKDTADPPQPSVTEETAASQLCSLPYDYNETITRALARFVIDGLQPITVVENESFRYLLEVLEPRYVAPTCESLQKVLDQMYEKEEVALKKEIADTENIAITHESWMSLDSASFETITAHYIKKDNWEMRSKVLQTTKIEGSHTAESIGEALKEAVDKWQFQTIPTVVSDNAVDEVRVFSSLGWPRLTCIGQSLKLAVKSALAVPEVSKLVAKGRRIVTRFQECPEATDLLAGKQKLLLSEDYKGHHRDHHQGQYLIQDVPTRWDTTLKMLARLLEQIPALHAVIFDPSAPRHVKTLQTHLYTFEEQSTVESILGVLDPFKQATIVMCGDTEPTLHRVLPCLKKLEATLDLKADDGTTTKKLKNSMMDKLNRQNFDSKEFKLACLLHPDTKQMRFVDSEVKSQAVEILTREAWALVEQLKTDEENQKRESAPSTSWQGLKVEWIGHVVDEDTEPEAKKAKLDSHWLDDVIQMEDEKAGEPLTKELQLFLLEARSNEPALKWWSQRVCLFPVLSILARKYLSVPASSVPSERVFSLGGNIISKKLCNLLPDSMDLLIFLNKNQKGQ